jgi:hypothetical protein
MSDIIVNGGFELDDASWTYEGDPGYAGRGNFAGWGIPPYDGSWFGYSFMSSPGTPSVKLGYVVQADIPIVRGALFLPRLFVRFEPDDEPTTPIGAILAYQTDTPGGPYTWERFEDVAGVWHEWTPPPLTFDSDTLSIRLYCNVPLSRPGNGYVAFFDLVSVDMLSPEARVMRVKYAAIEGAIEALSKLHGPSEFYTDLDGRIYTRLAYPDEDAELKLPYACVCLADDDARDNLDEDRTFDVSFTVSIFVFLPESPESATKSAALEAACNAENDLRKTLGEDPTLGGRVQQSKIVRSSTTAGFGGDEDVAFGLVELDFEVRQIFGVADLGPST